MVPRILITKVSLSVGGKLAMSRSRFTNVVVFTILILELCGNGCANLREVSGVEACLDKVWDSISSTSESSRPISVLNLDRQMICEIEGFAPSGSTLSRNINGTLNWYYESEEECIKRCAKDSTLNDPNCRWNIDTYINDAYKNCAGNTDPF